MKTSTKAALTLGGFLGFQYFRCQKALKQSLIRLQGYANKHIDLSYGQMSYVDVGQGEVILSLHGIFGGYDQSYQVTKSLKDSYRLLCPSRFGYLESDVKGQGTPKEQAEALLELLDALEIDQVFLYGISAGGTSTLRFALDYPERVKGIILHSSAMPYVQKQEYEYKYNPSNNIFINNFTLNLMEPFFKSAMGLTSEAIQSIMPVQDRKEGVIIDSSISNPDMARHFDDYPIENLNKPVLIFQAIDDKLINYRHTLAVEPRFPNAELILFDSGGHLMIGNEHEIDTEVRDFIEAHK